MPGLSGPLSEPPEELVPVTAGAAILGVDRKFIYRRIADRTLPAYRIAGSKVLRLRRADVEALKQPVSQPALPQAQIDYIEKLVAAAPPLSDEQRAKLSELLKPARRSGAER